MRSILLIAAACFLGVLLGGCCGGQPTLTLGLPTVGLSQQAVQPTTSVTVPLRADYTGLQTRAAAGCP